ncbi:Siroheme synthase [Pluralibacter gergoviae]|nr:Siroheme synthase [Pluralibacter gergoviae]
MLVIGGGDVAARKISLLRRAGARVQIVAQALSPDLRELVENQQAEWLAQAFDEAQLDRIFLVIAATDDPVLNRRVHAAAEARQRLVNVVDDRPLCTFIFPSIVDRSPILVAISSGGTAPVLARLLREKLGGAAAREPRTDGADRRGVARAHQRPPDHRRPAPPLLGAGADASFCRADGCRK